MVYLTSLIVFVLEKVGCTIVLGAAMYFVDNILTVTVFTTTGDTGTPRKSWHPGKFISLSTICC